MITTRSTRAETVAHSVSMYTHGCFIVPETRHQAPTHHGFPPSRE